MTEIVRNEPAVTNRDLGKTAQVEVDRARLEMVFQNNDKAPALPVQVVASELTEQIAEVSGQEKGKKRSGSGRRQMRGS